MQYFQYTKLVTLPAGETIRIWDNTHSVPYKNFTIFASGQLDGTKVTASVIFGGTFQDADSQNIAPYSDAVVAHVGGEEIQAADAIGTATGVAGVIYNQTTPLPANSISMPNKVDTYAMPVVVELISTATVPVQFSVTFYGETLGSCI
jgi:hypothetical protein